MLFLRVAALLGVAGSLGACSAGAGANAPRQADLGAADVRLLSPDSFTSVLGDDVRPVDTRLPGTQYAFRNATASELLVLYQSPGTTRHSISEISIQSLARPEGLMFPGEPAHFRTGRGVRLGISRAGLVKILGEPTREAGGTLYYRLERNAEPVWLEAFNMPYYRGSYTFAEGRLVSLIFGFPTP